jgi:hypothetical protein
MVSSSSMTIYGEAVWSPLDLLDKFLDGKPSNATRFGVRVQLIDGGDHVEMLNALFRFGSSQRHSSSHKYVTPASIILCD